VQFLNGITPIGGGAVTFNPVDAQGHAGVVFSQS
jgi:hypothetical protein